MISQPARVRAVGAVSLLVLGSTLMWLGLRWNSPGAGDDNPPRVPVKSAQPVAAVPDAPPAPNAAPPGREAVDVSKAIEAVGAETRRPIPAARVLSASGSELGSTNESGILSLSSPADCVVVEHQDHAPAVAAVDPRQPITRVELRPALAATGLVIDQDGNPLPGATVTMSRGLAPDSWPSATAPSDRRPAVIGARVPENGGPELQYSRFADTGNDGRWHVGRLSAGAHMLVATKPGYVMTHELDGLEQYSMSLNVPSPEEPAVRMVRIYVGALALGGASAAVDVDYIGSCTPFVMTYPEGVKRVEHAQSHVLRLAREVIGVDKSYTLETAPGVKQKVYPLVAVATESSAVREPLNASVRLDVIGRTESLKERVPLVPLDEWQSSRIHSVSIADLPPPLDIEIESRRNGPSSEVEMSVRWSLQASSRFIRKFHARATDGPVHHYRTPAGYIMFGPANDVLLDRSGGSGWQQVFSVGDGNVRCVHAPAKSLPCVSITIEGNADTLKTSMISVTRVLGEGDGPSLSYRIEGKKRVLACELGRYRCVLLDHKFTRKKTVEVTCSEAEPTGTAHFVVD